MCKLPKSFHSVQNLPTPPRRDFVSFGILFRPSCRRELPRVSAGNDTISMSDSFKSPKFEVWKLQTLQVVSNHVNFRYLRSGFA